MMLPNQITTQTFSQNGKGGYKAIEVDAFIQRVYQSYNKLYHDNKLLLERLDEALPMLDEYNKSKNSIADALIWAKSTAEKNIEEARSIADKLISDANEKADKIFEEKKAEADAYYNEKTAEADKKVAKATADLESLEKQADSFSDKYIADVNQKAQAAIEEANSKAASIVADAYSDAKAAKEKAENLITQANKELNAIKAEASKIKNELLSLISFAQKAAEEVDSHIFDPVELISEIEEVQPEAPVVDETEIEPFSLDGVEFTEIEDNDEADVSLAQTFVPSENEYVRFFDRQLPDVNDILSGFFAAASEDKASGVKSEDENSFKFTNIFADPADRGDTRIFNSLMKDSE